MKNIKNLIEAAIFLSTEPISDEELSKKLNISIKDARLAVENLQNDYLNRGIKIVNIGNGYKFITDKNLYNDLKEFVKDKPIKLSSYLLEVLAVVAYNQPITKSEIEHIRGKNSDGAIRSLLEKGLIEVSGRRSTPGRPKVYRTTKNFLYQFKLKSIDNLPNWRNNNDS